jgi:cytidylate kinase
MILIKKIQINGRALSGKDTVADYLVKNYEFKKLFYAEGIYEEAYKQGMTFKDRELLIKIGESARAKNPDYWVNWVFNKEKQFDKVVISDCRRANEYLKGIQEGYLPVRITADFDIRVQRAIERDGFYPDTDLWENESEIGADPFDYIEVENNGTLEELHETIDAIMKSNLSQFVKSLQEKYLK